MPDLPIKTPEELVTLASIVEKETGPAGRALARRRRVRQPAAPAACKLQSDPTIIYGLVGGKGTLGRPIMRSEIEQPTPYNTYVIEGLPPGPIANPGRASLEAAANPARTKELYFVADGTGGHVFAENLRAAPAECRQAAPVRAAGALADAGSRRPVRRARATGGRSGAAASHRPRRQRTPSRRRRRKTQ